ncbi:MAG: hypothetical protein JKY37_34180 [Nannocystaceae bacterium]|nr:hypothetical protein [Nannocystaceae bacterium]
MNAQFRGAQLAVLLGIVAFPAAAGASSPPPPEPNAPAGSDAAVLTASPDLELEEAPSTVDAKQPDSTSSTGRPRFPRLVLAGGPFIGPHAIGSEECRAEARTCEKHGSFFGLGLQIEIRGRLYKPLYVHARGFIAKNVSPADRVYRGVGGGSVGLGAYGRRVFGRAELIVLSAYGDNSFTPPFHDSATGRDTWGHTAGLISAGFRQPIRQRLAAELWAGAMIGPRSERTAPGTEPDRRVLPTFMLGLNVAFDAWP